MKGDANLSTIKATYFPPAIQPGFMGARPPVKNGYGSLSENGGVNYFQNYRNENLCKIQMPPYEWGLVRTPYSPRPDLVAANKVRERAVFQPRNDIISVIDPIRQAEVDNFYRACQMHREQYKDHSGRLHPLDYFEKSDFDYHCSPDLTSTYLRCPTSYTQYKHPHVFPKTLERTRTIPPLPERSLHGRYSRYYTSVY